jgi:NH3-dependent NAD+ synthetase
MVATSLKQSAFMAMLYNRAERRHFAVAATASGDEHDLAFFVQYGDGGEDLSPIQHLSRLAFEQVRAVTDDMARKRRTKDLRAAPVVYRHFDAEGEA